MTAAIHVERTTAHAVPPLCLGLAHESAEVRRVLGAAARHHGFEVIDAASGVELVSRLAAWSAETEGNPQPDILTLSCKLEGLSVPVLLQSLRTTPWAAPTIVIAGSENERAWMDVPGSIIRAVMVWPFDPDDFVTVARFLARRGRLDDEQRATPNA